MDNKNNNPQSSESEKQSFNNILFRLMLDPPQSSEDKEQLFRDIFRHFTDNQPQFSESERREESSPNLVHERAKEDIKDIRIAREERKKYANRAFWFMYLYVGLVIAITIWVSFGLSLPSTPLAVLISTIPASMALFGWVLRGLFPIDKK